jgi:acetyl esterase
MPTTRRTSQEVNDLTYSDGSAEPGRLKRVGQAASGFTGGGLAAAARLGRLHPAANSEKLNVDVIRNLSYTETGSKDHLLDIYAPKNVSGPLPVVLYIHGGAFHLLSKETHWMMGLAFASRGYVVASINYRLAPVHKFPAAARDAASAYLWVIENIAKFGGDPSRIVVAGESAGANLAASLAVMTSFERPESWAQEVFDSGITPQACLPACGILQVSDTQRFRRRRKMPNWVYAQIEVCEKKYLNGSLLGPGGTELADPLLVLESEQKSARQLPPFFALVGTRDPLLDDTRRLERALEKRGVAVEARYYRGGVHAFHAVPLLPTANRSWQDKFDFLERVLAESAPMIPSARRPSAAEALDDWYA